MSGREIVVVHYLDHVAFQTEHNPGSMVPAPCLVIGFLHEETDDYIRVVNREEGPLGEEPHPRAHGMVLPKGAVTDVLYTGVEAIPDQD